MVLTRNGITSAMYVLWLVSKNSPDWSPSSSRGALGYGPYTGWAPLLLMPHAISSQPFGFGKALGGQIWSMYGRTSCSWSVTPWPRSSRTRAIGTAAPGSSARLARGGGERASSRPSRGRRLRGMGTSGRCALVASPPGAHTPRCPWSVLPPDADRAMLLDRCDDLVPVADLVFGVPEPAQPLDVTESDLPWFAAKPLDHHPGE